MIPKTDTPESSDPAGMTLGYEEWFINLNVQAGQRNTKIFLPSRTYDYSKDSLTLPDLRQQGLLYCLDVHY